MSTIDLSQISRYEEPTDQEIDELFELIGESEYEPTEDGMWAFHAFTCSRCGSFSNHSVEECEQANQEEEFRIEFSDEKPWPKSIQDVL